jgi:hypothetical protein
MHKKILLIMIASTMLFFTASAEQTCVWVGWWHSDVWGNFEFYKTPSGTTEATFDGYDKYPAGIIEGSLYPNKNGLPCIFKGTWKETKRLSAIGGDTESNSGEIELEMSASWQSITGRYKHTSGDWHGFATATPGKV